YSLYTYCMDRNLDLRSFPTRRSSDLFAMMMQNSSINTYIQTHSLPAFRARIMSYYVMAFQGIFPIGSLLTGAMAEAVGLKNALYIMGSIGVLISVCFYIYLRLHIQRKLFKIEYPQWRK